jgi:hypothetical protein
MSIADSFVRSFITPLDDERRLDHDVFRSQVQKHPEWARMRGSHAGAARVLFDVTDLWNMATRR